MGTHHAGETVAIGDRQCRVPQLSGPRDQLIRMRGAFEEGEVGVAVQFGVGNDRALPRGFGSRRRQTFGWWKLRHDSRKASMQKPAFILSSSKQPESFP